MGSEVRYREQARKHLGYQGSSESSMIQAATTLAALEAERSRLWDGFAASYQEVSCATGGAHPQRAPSLGHHELDSSWWSSLPEVPDMPSASGAVLMRGSVSILAPSGLFGMGGTAWKQGAKLILTLHGYLHLFF